MKKKEYLQLNKEWLASKATDPGVKPLAQGIYYKILASGNNNGCCPTLNSIVIVHYTGWTIDSKEFDSSRNGTPGAFRLRDLIEGWIIAIQKMHVGDRWELYLPAEMGYGNISQPGIPGGSTLIFDIELLGIS